MRTSQSPVVSGLPAEIPPDLETRGRPEAVIAALAAGQYGVVSRGQLLAAGLTRDVVDHRVTIGWLRRVHRGVYRVGPMVAPRAREWPRISPVERRRPSVTGPRRASGSCRRTKARPLRSK